MDYHNYKFLVWHLTIPLLLFIGITVLLESTNIDITIASNFYDPVSNQFIYKNNWLTSTVLHEGGRRLSILILLIVIVLYVSSFRSKKLNKYQSGFAFLIVSMITSTLLVSTGKAITNVSCPWDLEIFGGNTPYIRNFEELPPGVQPGHCFPAAHASAGYALLSFYFFCLVYFPRYRYIALFTGIIFGVLYGGAQQLRGAHFLSHDVWTLFICWIIPLILAPLFFSNLNNKSAIIHN